MKVAALCVSAWLLVLPFSFSDVARAAETEEAKEVDEGNFYVGLFGGFAYPEKLRNVSNQRTGAQPPDRSVGASVFDDPDAIFGAKIGFIPDEEYTWFGMEGEFFSTSTRLRPVPGSLGSATLEVKAFSLNILLRYPKTWIEPHVGIGPSWIWADSFQLEGRDKTIATLGLNLLAGLRLPIADRFMVFVEYKHNRSRLDFNNFNVDFNLNAVIAGAALMF